MKIVGQAEKIGENFYWISLTTLFILLNAAVFPAAAREKSNEPALLPRTAAGRLVFKLKDANTLAAAKHDMLNKVWEKKFQRKYHFKNIKPLDPAHQRGPGKKIYHAGLAEDQAVREVVRQLKNDPEVEWAEPVYYRYCREEEPVVPDDPRYIDQSYLNVMNFPLAWNISIGDSSVVVAVIDTGIDFSHPDLSANIRRNIGEIAGDGLDNDDNGFIDDIRGWDFVSVPGSEVFAGEDAGPPDNDPSDVHGHGTHVAGIIGANGNNGEYGVGGSWQVSLLPVRAGYKNSTGRGVLTTVDIAAALYYACDNGADIVNMSFGGPEPDMVEREAINYCAERNVLLVAAAGNNGSSEPAYPAAFEPVFAVASVETNNMKVSDCSNFGIWIDAAACGKGIYSTLPLDQGGFGIKSGTSMAAAMVSAEAALLKALYPGWAAGEIAERIRATATNINDFNPDYHNLSGAGLINVFQALNGSMVSSYCGLVSLEISENQEGDDTYLDPGESFYLRPTIRNFGKSLKNVSLILTSGDPYINISDNSISLGSLPHDQRLTAATDFFAVTIAPDAPVNYQARLDCQVYLDSSPAAIEPINLLLNPFMRNKVVVASGTGELGYMDSRIVRDDIGNLTIFYRSTGFRETVAARHRDIAGNWQEPKEIPGKNHAVKQGAGEKIHVVYSNNDSLYYRLYDYQTDTWLEETCLLSGNFNENPDQCAVGADGLDNPHVVWSQGMSLHYRYFDGTEWSSDQIIANLTENIKNPAIFLIDGQPLILWSQNNGDSDFTPDEIDMLRPDSNGDWNDIAVVAPDITNKGFSVADDSPGKLRIVYDSSGSSIDYAVFNDGWSEETVYSNCLGMEKTLLAIEANNPHIVRLSKPNWGEDPLLYGMRQEQNLMSGWTPFTQIAVQDKLVQLDQKDFKIDSRGNYLLSGSCICNNSIIFYSSEVNEDHYPSRPQVKAGSIAGRDIDEIEISLSSSQEHGIAAYRLALGAAPGSDDILGWYQSDEVAAPDGSLDTVIPVADLILQPGRSYYVSVQAVGNNGYRSPIGSGNGLYCPGGQVFDADNDVDGLDLAAFAAALTVGDNSGDINGDTITDDYDFADFVRVFGLRD